MLCLYTLYPHPISLLQHVSMAWINFSHSFKALRTGQILPCKDSLVGCIFEILPFALCYFSKFFLLHFVWILVNVKYVFKRCKWPQTITLCKVCFDWELGFKFCLCHENDIVKSSSCNSTANILLILLAQLSRDVMVEKPRIGFGRQNNGLRT